MCEIPIKDGYAYAEWELIERDSGTSMTLEFTAALVFEEQPGESLGEFRYSVRGEFAPSYTWGAASSRLPIPRFMGCGSSVSLKISVPLPNFHS